MPEDQRRPEKRREARVEFLGEQDGPPERRLKELLAAQLRQFPGVCRAYLARVGFAPSAAVSVALCLTPASSEAATVVDAVGAIVVANVPANVALDIIFVDEEEEDDLKRVCRPFLYVAET